jgi:hypothetical protein
MSEMIICRHCAAENPPGSKFCNNCGTTLPPSTHILCPNCQTANPRNRLYCDACGTRLVKEAPPPTKPPAEEQSGIKRFDLPARPPGDTGELDPTAVPDWLRTGRHRADETADPDEPEALDDRPPLSDSAEELPGWLVEGEEDVNEVFAVPSEITTEHFLELLQEETADDAEEIFDPHADDEDAADLPDWLAATTEQADEEKPEKSWLDELGPAQTGVLETADSEEERPDATTALSELPDWLTDIGPAHTAELRRTEEVDSDWLDALEPAYTGPLAEAEDEPFDLEEFAFTGSLSEQKVSETGPLPDWLAGIESIPTSEADDWDDSFEDWFDETDEDDDLTADWIDSTATTIPVTEPTADSDRSDWLAAADDEPDWSDPLLTDEDTAEPAAESDWLAAADDEPDWSDPLLTDEDTAEPAAGSDWLSKEEGEPDWSDLFPTDADVIVEPTADADWSAEETGEIDWPDPFLTEESDVEELAGDSDWLTELSALSPAELAAEEEATIAPTPEPDEAELPPLAPEPVEEAPTADKADEAEDLDFEEFPADEEIPEWVSQLGPPTAGSGDTGPLESLPDDDLARNEDLPDWLTDMMPADDRVGATLSGLALADPDYVDPLEGIPEELAGAELPDWLHDAPAPREPGQTGKPTAPTEMGELPDWLKQAPEESEESAKLSAELSDLLGPPVSDPAADLSKADIPDWLQALKPTELSGQTPVAALAVTSGPLSGVPGVLAIEPVIAQPRLATPNFVPFTVSKEQREQVNLLEQIVATVVATEAEAQRVVSVRQPPVMSRITQLGLAVLLLLALVLGLWGPALFVAPTNPAPALVDLHTAVNNVAGQPVLLVFDYTPALAGELEPQATMLLEQLARNGSPVVSLSQYTSGQRLAALQTAVSHPDNRYHLGYLPGEAIGIRQLGPCLAASANCEAIVGRSLSPEKIQVLADVSLVIVLTGERDNLVNWIEQLAVYDEITLVAGITQSLHPVAAPYVASGQLAGLSTGLNDTVAYHEGLLGQPAPIALLQQQNAQGMAQLVVALLLLAGLFVYARRT